MEVGNLGKFYRLVVAFFICALVASWFLFGWVPTIFTLYIPNGVNHAYASTSTFSDLSGYRWFVNTNSSTAGSAYAATNTSMTSPEQGTAFRLRLLMHNPTSTMDAGATIVEPIVDSTGDSGSYSSITAPTTSTIYISHYYATNKDLVFAKSTNAGKTFTTSSIESTNIVGQYTAISAPTTSSIFVIHFDSTNSDLRFASSSNGGTTWATKSIDTQGLVGLYGSIAAWDANKLFISYQHQGNNDLRFGKSTDGGVNWTTSTIDSANVTGLYTSIAVPSGATSSYVYISYQDSTANSLRFARSTNGGASFAATSTITVGGIVGKYTAIAAPTTSTIFIAYYNQTNDRLEFAKSTNGGTTFTTSTIASGYGQYNSIAAPTTSTIYISTYDGSNFYLAYSKNAGASWQVVKVDNGSSNIGQYTSIVAPDVDHAFMSYYDVTAADLKFAKTLNYKLQYATRGVDNLCDGAASGETYGDVATSTGAIRFYDNSTPLDRSLFVASSGDPIHGSDSKIVETYVEANPFNNTSSISGGNDGIWDFSLVDYSAVSSTVYCFRTAQDDDTLLGAYSQVPQLTSAARTLTQSAYEWYNGIDSQNTVAVISNPSTVADYAQAMALDSTNGYIYVAGFDGLSSADKRWRIEKRGVSSGTLIYATTTNPSSYDDEINAIAINVASGTMYLGGYDESVSSTDDRWRIEARNLSDGSLIYATTTNPSANSDQIKAIAINAASSTMYVVGYDSFSSTDQRWRIEARNLSDGSLIYATTTNPTSGNDLIYAIALDTASSTMYLGGVDIGSNTENRVEKRNLSNGSLVYNTSTDPTANADVIYAIALDKANNLLYTAGADNGTLFGTSNIHYEKRTASTGALVTSTSTAGSGDGNVFANILALAVDPTNSTLYGAGYDGTLSPTTAWLWRFEKRSTSNLGVTYKTISTPLALSTGLYNTARAMIVDVTSSLAYLAGADAYSGAGNEEWHMEKRNLSDGTTAWGSALAAVNTTTTAPAAGTPFRLSALIHIGGSALPTSSESFTLQVATSSGACDTGFATTLAASYANVTTSTGPVRFFDNPTPSTGVNPWLTELDPNHSTDVTSTQTYVEQNNFSNDGGALAVSQDGIWNFPLVVATSTPGSTSYCFRIVKASGSQFDTYSVMPEILTSAASTTFTQSAYRFYSNANSTSTGAALAAQDTTSTAPNQETPFRLKMLIHAAANTVAQSGATFKLQFGALNGTCASTTYADVATSTGVIRFYDNSTPSNATTISASSSDPSHSSDTLIPQTYVEQNNFSNSSAAIYAGQDGMWDFSLVDQGMTDGGTYCFRIINSSGSQLDTYSKWPALTKGGPATASTSPTYGAITTSTVTINWTAVGGATYYRLERSTNGNTFSEVVTSTLLTYNNTSLASTTTYYYRYRAANSGGNGGYSPSSSVATLTGYSSGTLVSVIIDTSSTNGVAPNSIYWEGTMPTGTVVKFQFAAATSTAGPWNAANFVAWNGSSCDSSSYYTPSGPSAPVEVKALCHASKRYLRYKVYVNTADASVTPTIDRIILNYAK